MEQQRIKTIKFGSHGRRPEPPTPEPPKIATGQLANIDDFQIADFAVGSFFMLSALDEERAVEFVKYGVEVFVNPDDPTSWIVTVGGSDNVMIGADSPEAAVHMASGLVQAIQKIIEHHSRPEVALSKTLVEDDGTDAANEAQEVEIDPNEEVLLPGLLQFTAHLKPNKTLLPAEPPAEVVVEPAPVEVRKAAPLQQALFKKPSAPAVVPAAPVFDVEAAVKASVEEMRANGVEVTEEVVEAVRSNVKARASGSVQQDPTESKKIAQQVVNKAKMHAAVLTPPTPATPRPMKQVPVDKGTMSATPAKEYNQKVSDLFAGLKGRL